MTFLTTYKTKIEKVTLKRSVKLSMNVQDSVSLKTGKQFRRLSIVMLIIVPSVISSKDMLLKRLLRSARWIETFSCLKHQNLCLQVLSIRKLSKGNIKSLKYALRLNRWGKNTKRWNPVLKKFKGWSKTRKPTKKTKTKIKKIGKSKLFKRSTYLSHPKMSICWKLSRNTLVRTASIHLMKTWRSWQFNYTKSAVKDVT